MTEGSSLLADLDALEVVKGPPRVTCAWWSQASEAERAAVIRNAQRVGHTRVTKTMRLAGLRVTEPGIRDHVADSCDRCQS